MSFVSTSRPVASGADLTSGRARLDVALSPVGDNPILSGAATVGESVYWLSPICVEGLLADPLARYYGYYSTDHDDGLGGNGGIFLATADDVEGPWAKRNADGSLTGGTGDFDGPNGTAVYIDPAAVETETPSVIWMAATGLLHLYYQDQTNGGQYTMLATSQDGLDFTKNTGTYMVGGRPGPAIGPYNTTLEVEGDTIHTGYFNPFFYGEELYAQGLLVGGEYAQLALWHSDDGIAWELDFRAYRYSAHAVANPLQQRTGIGLPFVYQGRLYTLNTVSTFASFGGGAADRFVAVAPLADDLRTIGKVRQALTPSEAWESDNLRHARPFTAADGQLYAFVQFDNNIAVYRMGL